MPLTVTGLSENDKFHCFKDDYAERLKYLIRVDSRTELPLIITEHSSDILVTFVRDKKIDLSIDQ